MRTLTQSEKRTVRFAIIGISIYLALFGGLRGWKYLEARRAAYQQLTQEAKSLQQQMQLYQDKADVAKTLMESFRMDPMQLSKASIVAEASAALQKAAASGGLLFGPIRETSARASGKELASMQLEGAGPVPAVMAFLHNVTNLGFPLVIDSVQLSADPSKPGAIKVNLTIVILDFEQWKEEAPAQAKEPARSAAFRPLQRSNWEPASELIRDCSFSPQRSGVNAALQEADHV